MSSELATPEADAYELSSTAPGDHLDPDLLDISVVMPCLNEEASVAICVSKAWHGIRAAGLTGEVIVADNGSTDRSVAWAEAAGARVVHQPLRGYGNAYLMGFEAARGRIVVMGDSDDSYDFTKIPDLVRPIEEGYDYVLGSRFAGHILPKAMTWTHRRIGNPALTAILNTLFGLRVTDAHSGFRAITRDALAKIALSCEGMELASEIAVKAALANLRTTEVPITYHPRIGVSKLNSLRDGLRHLRFLFQLSPDYLFIAPGLILTALGFVGQLVMLLAAASAYALLGKIALAMMTLSGAHLLVMGAFARTQSQDERPESRRRVLGWIEKIMRPESSPATTSAFLLVGVVLVVAPFLTGSATLVAAGGAASSVAILGLVMLALGSRLGFDALFLSLVLRRPGAGKARTHPAGVSSGEQAADSPRPATAAVMTGEPAELDGQA